MKNCCICKETRCKNCGEDNWTMDCPYSPLDEIDPEGSEKA